MAAHSNRSPSRLSSRPTNPNPRNSENNSATRKSFSGNNPFAKPSVLTNSRRFDPITPANSPSDFARRRSVGKEGMGSHLKDCEEKENNEKDNILKASKLQSPATGSKNFMSPTISAASKFTPSPRKKVLVERNDPVRTSISLADGKAMFFSNMSSDVSEDLESKSEMGHHQNQKTGSSLDLNAADSEKRKAVQEGPPASKPPKKVTFSDVPSDSQQAIESLSESVITDTDSNSLKLESSLMSKVSSSSISPSIAPLDADPSLPPYDPKTNYLSPRPQFLHYKPNPRIEILLNKEKGLDPDEFKQLGDGFMAEIMSENFSDSEGTEESHTEDSQKEELEVNAPADTVIGVEETEDVPYVSEPSESLPVSTPVANAISEENLVQKNEKKSWALSRLMCFSMLLMFLIACVSITLTHSRLSDELAFKDLSLSDLSKFYHQSRVAASAKVNFDRLARNIQLSVNSISFISKVTNELGKGEKLGPLQFKNLSDLQKNTWNGEHIREDVGKELVENLEEDELEEDLDTEMETLEEEAYAEVDSDDNFDKEFDTQDDNVLEAEVVSSDSVKIAELESEHSEDIQIQREVVSSVNTPDWSKESYVDHQSIALVETEVEAASDREEAEKSHADINLGPSDCAAAETTSLDQTSPSDANPLSDKVVQSSPMLESPPSEDKILAHYVMGVSSFFAALAAVAAFIYQHKRNPSLTNVVQADPLLSKQQTGCAFTGKSSKHDIYQEKQFSQNWQTEVDVLGESCPSEMSSFQKSASYSKKELREVQSSEGITRKYYSKRESLASSSEYSAGSPSYGSFTTYERIPIKSANGEEEIITPVRRSSRIRNHFSVIV